MAPPTGPAQANGVIPISAAAIQKGAAVNGAPRGSSAKASAPRLKVVVRRLPPGLTQAEFEVAVGDEWRLGGGKVDWVLYKPGKISKDLAKPSRPARAYLHLTDQSHLGPFAEKVRQTSFVDARNTTKDAALIGPPSVEFAPYPRIPGGRRRNDARQGLIDQDPEFKDFLESLTNPVAKPAAPDAAETLIGVKEEKVTTTPLIEHLREKKAAKDKAAAKPAIKHAHGDSKDEKASEKKILVKGGKENAASPEKAKKPTRAERDKAAKEAVKVLSKEAAATSQPVAAASAQAAPIPTGPAAERKRERGSAAIAANILKRDLGLGGPAGGRRGKRDAPPETTQKPAEATAAKEPSAPVPAQPTEKPTPTSPKGTRSTRAERRANKAALVEKTNSAEPAAEASKVPTGPATPAILKKAPAAPTQPPAQPQAPKGPAPTHPPSKTPVAPASTPGPTPKPPKPTLSDPTARSAFLKHANPSQGITEPLLHSALSVFGAIEKVEIDKRKGFAYVDFADPDGLVKAIKASPVKVAQGAVQVLERKDKPAKAFGPPQPHAGVPARGGPVMRGGRGGGFRGGRGGRGGFGGAASVGDGGAAQAQTPAAAAVAASPVQPASVPDAVT
ncbi:hypothetical protein H2201_002438 [Coniosporium apollinis]|uniref:RRM domain-containing protein n=1 Tax=Coniosporium apollinis TaxID=61459 RepID=A0ABQ9NYW6_9PEZI|nr:hypothetical protein H2201_002438 [Coniosporium apollinis]